MSDLQRPNDRRRAAVALALLLPAPTIGALAAMVLLPGTAIGQAIFIASKVWVLLLPLVWHTCVDRQPLSLSRATRGGFGVAIALGLLITAAIVAFWFTLGPMLIDPQTVRDAAAQNGIGSKWIYILGAIYWITANSLLEEYVWRWFTFRKFEAVVTPRLGWLAVLLSAAGFTLHHVVALLAQMHWLPALLASAGVFIGGAAWSWLYLRYRSVWVCYVSHAIVDVPIFVIGYWMIFGG